MKQQPDIDVVIRYLEEPGNEEHKRSLDEWLQLDAANLDIFLETKALWQGEVLPAAASYDIAHQWQLLDAQLTATSLPPVTATVTQVPASQPVAKGKVKSMTVRVWWAAAAAAILVAAAVIIYRQPAYIAQQTAQNTDSLLLPDGTRLFLNAHTSVKYPRNFQKNSREIFVQQGEVFVDVKHMPEKPFSVHLKNVDIEVLGTSFDVKETKQGVKVFVQSGKVKAVYRNGKKSVILTPGEEAEMLLAGTTISTRHHRNNNPIAWKTGQLTFVDAPLSEVAEVLADYYKVNIVLKGDGLTDKKLLATFHKESLSEVLDILSKTLQVQAVQKDSLVEIY
ncbi:FecR family protein [Chitinophaga rhizophila]|uniref:FecR domain-containing protein n=1 Tax=Chitinophaga rhizophila TaxID=2866212 RepID=A0ABS7GKA5_9BACT|nr:FecR domain-containing protein [Chitinophaga rhizophila]MBW8687615.1 FecR domain-containing protein [Chitinophaga rhizophila]